MHIAFIPARKGSKALPFKNRFLFDSTADFIDAVPWFGRVIVSTDDDVIAEKARARGYEVHPRPRPLAGDAVSIKAVLRSVIRDEKIPQNAVIWLFYLPIVRKKRMDFERARRIIERSGAKSLCAFVPSKTHPFNCWRYDAKKKRLSQYVPNDIFRRQDLPPAWKHHHYLCCLRAAEIKRVNSELLNYRTYPVFIDAKTADEIIEIDTPEEYRMWKAHKGA